MKEFLFPAFCLHCDCLLDEAGAFLCEPCAQLLPWIKGKSRCQRCFLEPCACASLRFPFSRRIAVFSYEGPAQSLIHKFKFQRLEQLADLFASCLLVQIEKAKLPWPDLIVPIPHAPWHSLLRGYKSSELLAAALAKKMKIPARPALRRSLLSIPQRCKTKEERGRFKQTYRLCKGAAFADQSILLIDDVSTTGHTLVECARVLKEGFPRQISACTLALVES